MPESDRKAPSFDCDECNDSGYVFFQQGGYQFSRKCGCAVRRLQAQKLAIIPPAFKAASLERLQPDVSRHPKQIVLVEAIRQNPEGSYFLAGRFGTGKTYLMWALYRHAVMTGKRTVICTLSELIGEYKRFIQQSMSGQQLQYPRIGAEDLRQQHTRYSIFLDDVDKARPTEYVAEQLFELVDAVYAFGHQLVVTTNLSAELLSQHFERADERFGGAIVRRMTENAVSAELF
ncbi:MAG TPA: ATP-binding protein [Pyrinomonadaceae bacterium]|nr:ATP-binding protein [Pyrinomonadaceae bacterium]